MQIHIAMLIVSAIPALTSPVTELEEELRRSVERENELTSRHSVVSVAARSTGSSVTTANKTMILQLHNNARNTVQPPAANMPQLKWSNELATVAQNYANKCIWGHNGARSSQSRTFSNVGENLFVSQGITGFLRNAVNSWLSEKKNYDYSRNSCDGFCDQYTQIIWANTTHVGCGFKTCGSLRNLSSAFTNAKYVVCNYGPGGKFEFRGRKPYVKATGK